MPNDVARPPTRESEIWLQGAQKTRDYRVRTVPRSSLSCQERDGSILCSKRAAPRETKGATGPNGKFVHEAREPKGISLPRSDSPRIPTLETPFVGKVSTVQSMAIPVTLGGSKLIILLVQVRSNAAVLDLGSKAETRSRPLSQYMKKRCNWTVKSNILPFSFVQIQVPHASST